MNTSPVLANTHASSPVAQAREGLGFQVRAAHGEADLRAACALRAQAYGRKLPNVLELWREPDAIDRAAGVVVFVARDNASGEVIGTVRVATNQYQPLQIEGSTTLPDGYAGLKAEITRLAVRPGHDDPQVRLALFKAVYLECLARGVEWMVIGARSAALVRGYRRLGFTDVLADGAMVPLAHAGNLPHRVLAFNVRSAQSDWRAIRHPFYAFMVEQPHPEIEAGAQAHAIALAA